MWLRTGVQWPELHYATTTAQVVELAFSEPEVTEAIRSSLEAGGWLDPAWCPPEVARQVVDAARERVGMVADHFPVGTVVGRRLDQIHQRRAAPVPG